MTQTKKKIVLFSGLTLLFLHFLVLGAYLIKPGFWSTAYSYPYFQQNWNLFVPPPNCNYNLYAYDFDHVSEKANVFSEITMKHQKNRLKGYGPLLIALSNSIHYFEKEALEQNFANGKVEKNDKFLMIEKFVRNYLKNTRPNEFKNVKIILSVNTISEGKQRVYYN